VTLGTPGITGGIGHAMPPLLTLPAAAGLIRARRAEFDPAAALLVGVSGIDAAGKGRVSAELAAQLRAAGLGVAVCGLAGWLNLPGIRYNRRDPGGHYYAHAYRLDPFVRDLLLPLRARRQVDLAMHHADEASEEFRLERIVHQEVDVILAEGPFLFRRDLREIYDLAFWVECSFETALERAVARGQDGPMAGATRMAYQRINFPAQRVHFARDLPGSTADGWILNDFALGD